MIPCILHAILLHCLYGTVPIALITSDLFFVENCFHRMLLIMENSNSTNETTVSYGNQRKLSTGLTIIIYRHILKSVIYRCHIIIHSSYQILSFRHYSIMYDLIKVWRVSGYDGIWRIWRIWRWMIIVNNICYAFFNRIGIFHNLKHSTKAIFDGKKVTR